MTNIQFFYRGLLLVCAALALSGCDLLLLNPPGDIAWQQGRLIVQSTYLMLLIIVPVIILTLLFAWRYRASNRDATYKPEWDHSTQLELVIWSAPLMIIIALGAITWISTHTLDPYRPLDRIAEGKPVAEGVKPLEIEVVALDWKWLFLYPEQGIATLNEVAAPVDRPIKFKITAEHVMNSFYIPALAGQIYAMPGMQTVLHAVMNKPGSYEGFSANYSGEGFSHMRFQFKGISEAEFENWVQQTKSDGTALSREVYLELAKPSSREPVRRYSEVAPNLYKTILNRCVDGKTLCMDQMMAMDMGMAPKEHHQGHGAKAEDAAATPAEQHHH